MQQADALADRLGMDIADDGEDARVARVGGREAGHGVEHPRPGHDHAGADLAGVRA